MCRAQGGFGSGVIVDGARDCGNGGRYVGQHRVDMGKLVARESAGSNIGGQAGLNQLEIGYVPAVRAVPLVPHRDVVVPHPTFKNSGGVVEHIREIKIAGLQYQRRMTAGTATATGVAAGTGTAATGTAPPAASATAASATTTAARATAASATRCHGRRLR